MCVCVCVCVRAHVFVSVDVLVLQIYDKGQMIDVTLFTIRMLR